jgi:hypothetical protein
MVFKENDELTATIVFTSTDTLASLLDSSNFIHLNGLELDSKTAIWKALTCSNQITREGKIYKLAFQLYYEYGNLLIVVLIINKQETKLKNTILAVALFILSLTAITLFFSIKGLAPISVPIVLACSLAFFVSAIFRKPRRFLFFNQKGVWLATFYISFKKNTKNLIFFNVRTFYFWVQDCYLVS